MKENKIDEFNENKELPLVVKFTSFELIENLRKELQKHSEILAKLFPERVNRYGRRSLTRLWRISVQKFATSKSQDDALIRLKEILIEKFSAKAMGCLEIIRRFEVSRITALQFIEMIKRELGRISGEVKLTNLEFDLILGFGDNYIKRILDHFSIGNKALSNPNFKISLEELDDYTEIFKEILGNRAMKCLEIINKYRHINSDLKERRLHYKDLKDIKVKRYFQDIDSVIVAYWFGFLIADGSIEKGRPRISFELSSKDKDRIEAFADALDLDRRRIKDNIRLFYYKGELRIFQSSKIKFDCREMVKDLNKHGFSDLKKGEIGLPDIIKLKVLETKEAASQTGVHWSKTKQGVIIFAFLLGFFDGDGTYMGKYKGGESGKIYSSNKKLLEDIKKIYEIENNVNPCRPKDVNKEVLLVALHNRDRKYVSSKPLYYLTLGPDVFVAIMQSYDKSMLRKRTQSSIDPSTHYLGE